MVLMSTMKVQIQSKKLIKPSIPTPIHNQTVKLSLIDQLIPSTHIDMVFCYYPSGQPNEEMCTQLEDSLSQVLTKFYPLAGRLVLDDLSIDCNDRGVEFSQATVSGLLMTDILLTEGPKIEILNRFVTDSNWDDSGSDQDAPLVMIQVNKFDCGGLAIGIRVAHKVADAFSMIAFVNAWARASREGVSSVISPTFDLGTLLPTTHLLPPNPTSAGRICPNIVSRRFFFSKKTITSLEVKLRASRSTNLVELPSFKIEVVVVGAVIWKALIDLAYSKHGNLRPSLLVQPINLKGKTKVPILESSFGNLPMFVNTRFKVGKGTVELDNLVDLIGNAIKNTDPAKAKDADDLSSMVIDSFREAREEKMYNHKMDVHLFTSLCGLPLYEVDFGWGKPSWAGNVNKRSELVSLVDTKCGDGIEAWVSLKDKDMLDFQCHKDILTLTSLID